MHATLIRGNSVRPRKKPVPEKSLKLILLLKTFLSQPSDNDSLRAYQRDCWGRVISGETCVIELSGLAGSNLREHKDKEKFRQERIGVIREKMLCHHPKFVVMYGFGDEAHFAQIAGCPLVRDGIVKLGCTMIAFAKHPVAPGGGKRAAWVELGNKLRWNG
jgi:hypothetical protein